MKNIPSPCCVVYSSNASLESSVNSVRRSQSVMSGVSLASLELRLKQDWSTHTVLLSLPLLPQIAKHYENLEKHSRIRVLISFLLLDDNKREEAEREIRLVCSKALVDSEVWVRVTGEIVSARMNLKDTLSLSHMNHNSYGTSQSSSKSSSPLETMIQRCIDNFVAVKPSLSSSYCSSSFLPLELKYMDSSSNSSLSTNNVHFTPSFDMPILIPMNIISPHSHQDGFEASSSTHKRSAAEAGLPTNNSSSSSSSGSAHVEATVISLIVNPLATERRAINVAQLFIDFPNISLPDRVKIESFESPNCTIITISMIPTLGDLSNCVFY